eukprot:CAMPEP_0119154830 /NCGR_PEP_ID=MMETSP1310-20130426/51347_1 /TAXON_ID=464262 /ORGANISM="Genus nov. species nov., Strain RCC2339" /LENGTH=194 /DNA_ID=CAMNT_0007147399 /DNA_START=104 /DNA_END=685 /DNA_ORIENTATION=+
MSDFWMHAQFGSEHASTVQNESKRKECLQRLKMATKELIVLSVDSSALSADVMNEFCEALEAILLHHIKDTNAITTSSGTRQASDVQTAGGIFWACLMKTFGEKSTRLSLIKSKEKPSQGAIANLRVLESLERDFVLTHCRSDLIKVRAWILQALNMNVLTYCVSAVLADKSAGSLYTETSFMRNHEAISMLRS